MVSVKLETVGHISWEVSRHTYFCIKEGMTIAHNSDDSDKEKEKTQKKTTFEDDSDDAIPESMSKFR